MSSGRVLQVAVHGHYDVSLGFVKARRQGRRLPEVAAQADDFQVAIVSTRLASSSKLRSPEASSTNRIS